MSTEPTLEVVPPNSSPSAIATVSSFNNLSTPTAPQHTYYAAYNESGHKVQL